MDYTPITAVWEITMGCNMRCDHCGSSCAEALSDELTTEEALKVCDDMKTLGMKWITLSGGEPLTRKDWPILAGRLYKNGIIPNIITNGWLVNDEMVKTAEENGVETISISLDGIKSTHDSIRKNGAYDKVINAFRVLDRFNHVSGANTTVTKQNIDELDQIKKILVENNVNLWQIQIGLPMGNLAKNKDLIIDPGAIDYLLDYCHKTMLEGKIKVFPADCLGYYTDRESYVRQISTGSIAPVIWQGCNAGKRSFGLLHNGDVMGCTSIREKSFLEGNIRDTSLIDIWNNPEAFKWSRTMTKAELAGECKTCHYGDLCLGGCPNTRLTLNGSVYSENAYCSYNKAIKETKDTLSAFEDAKELLHIARLYASDQKWQLAALTLQRAHALDPDNHDILELDGFVNFSLGNFHSAKEANEKILNANPENAYALKGIGLSLHKLHLSQEGISYLQKATTCATPDNMDAFFDLAVVYDELGLKEKAIQIMEAGEARSPGFLSRVYPFYNQLMQQQV